MNLAEIIIKINSLFLEYDRADTFNNDEKYDEFCSELLKIKVNKTIYQIIYDHWNNKQMDNIVPIYFIENYINVEENNEKNAK